VLGVRRFGSGPPLVALHGFTLTGEQFAAASTLLGYTVVAPDLPGHGRSIDEPPGFDDVIRAVGSTIESLACPVPVIGYSQGARVGLIAALDRPSNISALVLVSANPGIEDRHDRATRATSDADVASKLITTDIDEFLDMWTSAAMTSTEHLTVEAQDADRSVRRQNSPAGLAAALTGYGQGAQPSVWDRLDTLPMPVLVMSGSRDEKYSLIADRMANMIPDAEQVTIDAAGHNPLLDAPYVAYGVISDFLNRRR
jgi:2-succinyl-6-hydroxy-2,4-cyclohexadiene-1-carboxylate synthase